MINVGIAGFGLAGKHFHAKLITGTQGLHLHSITSSQKTEIQNTYPECNQFDQFEDMVNQKDLHLVVVATPNHLHFEQCKLALLAGKHVVVDKPIAQTAIEAQKLLKIATEKKLNFTVFHNRRLDGDFLTVKEIIKNNTLGKIVSFQSNFNRFKPHVDINKWKESTSVAGGLYYDIAPHLIDQAIQLFGKPSMIYADIDNLRYSSINPDYFQIILKYPKLKVTLNASNLCAYPQERFVLHGLKGSYRKFNLDPQEENLKNNVLISEIGAPKDQGTVFFADSNTIYQSLSGRYNNYYSNVLDSIKSKSELLVQPKEAIEVMKLLELGLKSAQDEKFLTL